MLLQREYMWRSLVALCHAGLYNSVEIRLSRTLPIQRIRLPSGKIERLQERAEQKMGLAFLNSIRISFGT
jgi:hypothetical protein